MATGLRERLKGTDVLVGLGACVFRTPEIVTVARSCGFDFLLLDTEHGAMSISDVASIAVTAFEARLPCLVRVGGPHAPDLARVLDCGAEGVVVPHVERVEEALHIVAACRFQPVGNRSLPSPQLRLGFRVPPAAAMIDAIEREIVIVLMIESALGLENVEAIAAVPGVDILMIGANDLAADMGHLGDVCHADVLAGFSRVAAAARANGKAFSIIGVAEPLWQSHGINLGARLVVATNDINLLIDQGRATVSRLRGLV